MEVVDKIVKSIDYDALDHKWLAREYLQKHTGQSEDNTTHSEAKEVETEDSDLIKFLREISESAHRYYHTHHDTFSQDLSLKTITKLCSDPLLMGDVKYQDSQVFHLSHVFNQIIKSTRGLHKCYDCGTNARAMFLKLISENRGVNYVSHLEQQRMKEEYLVKKDGISEEISKCYQRMKEVSTDTVFIISLAVESFGHVWVIEKKFISGRPRYHHYQTSLNSHLLLDFIESKDYGKNLEQSLDIARFFKDLDYLLGIKEEWKEEDYRLFSKMFAFIPVSKVTKPDPGFCFTSITY
jgi:hypothetical protein